MNSFNSIRWLSRSSCRAAQRNRPQPSPRATRGLASVTPEKSRGPTAIVFMNMGGPSTTDEVGSFLSRLFVGPPSRTLPRVLPLTGAVRRRPDTPRPPPVDTRALHLQTQDAPRSQKQYAEIGGGSPIRRWSEHQARRCARSWTGRRRAPRRTGRTSRSGTRTL